MNVMIRRALPADLALLLDIEQDAFPVWQQSSRRALRLSLNSHAQAVFIAEVGDEKEPAGCLVLQLYKRTVRIYSIAVFSYCKGKGIGTDLMGYAMNYARSRGFTRISLEVDANNKPLIKWYKKFGFETKELIPDYYTYTIDALRMTLDLEPDVNFRQFSNLVVVDDPEQWLFRSENVNVVSARQYTTDEGYYSRKNLRVFNLCSSYKYQSLGYYVSLLATAREHRVIPSVTTIRDTKDLRVMRAIAEDIDEIIQQTLNKRNEQVIELNIYFGDCRVRGMKQLSQKIFQMFEIPMFRVVLENNSRWEIRKIEPLSFRKVPEIDFEFIQHAADQYFSQKRFQKIRLRNYEYDLAILVNPEEAHPPSDRKALELFKKAGEELDVYVEFIRKKDFNRLSEFDALFIRETTSVHNYTYQFARKAYAEGLVVIDDPWSILKCSNKIFLEERLRTHNIPTPKTHILYRDQNQKKTSYEFDFPVILKQPDSAFSLGVLKACDEQEFTFMLSQLFKKSELLIAQEFTPSEFDWRIGVLDNQPLFACKYYMAGGHWQIYDWKSGEEDPSGDSETLHVSMVPKKVLQTAVRAASLMGDGLYGVDLKEINGKVFVIEVNDNPNIDFGIEDLVLGKELYRKIIQSFKTRIEISRNISRFVSVDEI